MGDGASDAILYNSQDFVAEIKRLTDGKGVEVVYDGVGQATLLKGFDCLKPRGMMVAFGQSSGPAAPVDLLLLSQKGSLYVTRPTLFTYIASREDLEWRSSDLFRWIGEGKLKINIDKVYPLAEAAQAHRDLEGRKTIGKLLIEGLTLARQASRSPALRPTGPRPPVPTPSAVLNFTDTRSSVDRQRSRQRFADRLRDNP